MQRAQKELRKLDISAYDVKGFWGCKTDRQYSSSWRSTRLRVLVRCSWTRLWDPEYTPQKCMGICHKPHMFSRIFSKSHSLARVGTICELGSTQDVTRTHLFKPHPHPQAPSLGSRQGNKPAFSTLTRSRVSETHPLTSRTSDGGTTNHGDFIAELKSRLSLITITITIPQLWLQLQLQCSSKRVQGTDSLTCQGIWRSRTRWDGIRMACVERMRQHSSREILPCRARGTARKSSAFFLWRGPTTCVAQRHMSAATTNVFCKGWGDFIP